MNVGRHEVIYSMKHIQRIQQAINYIEQHLDHDFTLTDVSAAAFSSLSYMHRIFYQVTGYTMKEYIRQRRLAVSVGTLQSSKKSVLDIAIASGYQSAESFCRAFKKQFNTTPTDCREGFYDVSVCQPLDLSGKYDFIQKKDLDFHLSLEAVSLPAFEVMGFKIHTTLQDDQQVVDICEFANSYLNGPTLSTYFDLEQTGIYGVYTEMSDQDDFCYTIGGLCKACRVQEEQMVVHAFKAATYAKFTLNRNDRIKEAWHYIYGVWFPQIEAYRSKGYDFEIYHEDSTSIYIPMSQVPLNSMNNTK